MFEKNLLEIPYYSTFLFLFLIANLPIIQICAFQRPHVETDAKSIEVGPGPNAVRLKKGEEFVLNCSIRNVNSYDIVTGVEWTFENELDDVFKIETLDNDNIDYDHLVGRTTYKFDHHPTSADAGVYNCTFFGGAGSYRSALARATIRLTCDPVPKEGARSWRGLREDDPMRRDYKHVPSYTIYPGDEVKMECRATAYPRPKFKWFRILDGNEDDDLIGTARRQEIVDRSTLMKDEDYENDDRDDEHAIAQGDILHIKNARFQDRGYYCCTANNSDDYTLNLYFLVRVKNPLAALWPLLGIGIVAALLALIIGVSEHLRHKSEAKLERQTDPTNQKKAEQLGDVPVLQMTDKGADIKLRLNAKSGKLTKETIE
jgi:hypothetical protein